VIGLIAVGCAVAFRSAPRAEALQAGLAAPGVLARTVRDHSPTAAVPAVRDRRAVHDGVRRRLHGDRLPPDRGAVLAPQGIIGSIFLVYWSVRSRRPRRAAWSAASAAAGPSTWPAVRRPRASWSPSPTRSRWSCSPGPDHRGFFAGHAVASSAVSKTATHGRARPRPSTSPPTTSAPAPAARSARWRSTRAAGPERWA